MNLEEKESTVIWEMLGRVDYEAAELLQNRLRDARIVGRIPDVLLLVEHPPVLTIGRGGNVKNVLASRQALDAMGIRTHTIGRGGDVTYHGPGQIVGYPIMDLRERGRDVHRYLYDLEEVFIRLLGQRGIVGNRIKGATGVWVDNRKILAIGIGVRKWVTLHGFAFNVSPDLAHFQLIRPCGFEAEQVTSLFDLLKGNGARQDLERDFSSLANQIVQIFSEVFKCNTYSALLFGGDAWKILEPFSVHKVGTN